LKDTLIPYFSSVSTSSYYLPNIIFIHQISHFNSSIPQLSNIEKNSSSQIYGFVDYYNTLLSSLRYSSFLVAPLSSLENDPDSKSYLFPFDKDLKTSFGYLDHPGIKKSSSPINYSSNNENPQNLIQFNNVAPNSKSNQDHSFPFSNPSKPPLFSRYSLFSSILKKKYKNLKSPYQTLPDIPGYSPNMPNPTTRTSNFILYPQSLYSERKGVKKEILHQKFFFFFVLIYLF
jgi:hypothetical protein